MLIAIDMRRTVQSMLATLARCAFCAPAVKISWALSLSILRCLVTCIILQDPMFRLLDDFWTRSFCFPGSVILRRDRCLAALDWADGFHALVHRCDTAGQVDPALPLSRLPSLGPSLANRDEKPGGFNHALKL